MARRSRIKLALFLVILTGFGALFWRPIQQARQVAAVQGSLQRLEVTFNTTVPPDWLPNPITDAAFSLIRRMTPQTPKHRGNKVPGGDHGAEVYQERFLSLFRGRLEYIGIWDPERFRGDLGAALARISHLRHLELKEDGFEITEAEWAALCRGLRKLPRLEVLELGCPLITSAALAPLAGHSSLRSLTITRNQLTSDVTTTLATLPQLTSLALDNPFYQNGDGTGVDPDEAEWTRFCAGLRTLPRLESLQLVGAYTDAALAPLAAHPTLTSIKIDYHLPTPACTATFASMPRLKTLFLGSRVFDTKGDFSQQEKDAITAALPSVEVTWK